MNRPNTTVNSHTATVQAIQSNYLLSKRSLLSDGLDSLHYNHFNYQPTPLPCCVWRHKHCMHHLKNYLFIFFIKQSPLGNESRSFAVVFPEVVLFSVILLSNYFWSNYFKVLLKKTSSDRITYKMLLPRICVVLRGMYPCRGLLGPQ